MIKLLESKLFNILLPIFFFVLLGLVFLYGCILGISDRITLIVNSILTLLATFIAISFPLHVSRKSEEKRLSEEQKMVYMSVSEYVLNEILDNVIEIEDLTSTTKKSLEELKQQHNSDKAQKMAEIGIWLSAFEELVVSLSDKWHQCMVTSGLVAKVPDHELRDEIRCTYQKMDNLIKRLRRLTKFCTMALNSHLNIPAQFLDYQLNVKFSEAVKAVEKDIEIFLKQAKKTTDKMNEQLKAYKREVKIVEYSEEG